MTDRSETQAPKRHCMIVYAFYPLAETRVQREAEALVSQGYEVDVICLRLPNEPPVDEYRGVQVYRLPLQYSDMGGKIGFLRRLLAYLQFLLLAAIKLAQLHRRRPYHTVQVHNLPDFLVFCALVPKLKGVPVILDLHDLMPEFYAGRFGSDGKSLLGRLIRWQERVSCAFADHVITVSEHWRQTLIKRGVPADKCSVVMNLADENIFHPLPPEDNRPHLPRNGDLRLIYHGTVVERYGLDLAVRAVDRLRREMPNIHLTILGNGDYLDTLRQLVQELDLDEQVTIHGQLRPAAELPAIIRQADLGIVPYRNDVFTDGLLPTKLMEYAALGMPSVASRTTAIETYFRDTMVEFFTPNDLDDLVCCLRKLYHSPERLTDLAEKSEDFNRQYNWTRVGGEYVALVERLGKR